MNDVALRTLIGAGLSQLEISMELGTSEASVWRRMKALGIPANGRKITPLLDRFWPKVGKSDGCWEWLAARNLLGYGVFAVSKRDIQPAYRVAYELTYGPVPDGLELDHLCRNRGCVRPDHLEAVTHRTNLLRGDSIVGKRWRAKGRVA